MVSYDHHYLAEDEENIFYPQTMYGLYRVYPID